MECQVILLLTGLNKGRSYLSPPVWYATGNKGIKRNRLAPTAHWKKHTSREMGTHCQITFQLGLGLSLIKRLLPVS